MVIGPRKDFARARRSCPTTCVRAAGAGLLTLVRVVGLHAGRPSFPLVLGGVASRDVSWHRCDAGRLGPAWIFLMLNGKITAVGAQPRAA